MEYVAKFSKVDANVSELFPAFRLFLFFMCHVYYQCVPCGMFFWAILFFFFKFFLKISRSCSLLFFFCIHMIVYCLQAITDVVKYKLAFAEIEQGRPATVKDAAMAFKDIVYEYR
jgi:hypothetical protein